jgi:putative phosphoserine phosphatase / 1-acylglycerol-3-phosphate O-acyltransferase
METTSSRDRDTQRNYIAFFDLDQTLTRSISGNALVHGAYRKGLLTNLNLLKAIFLSFEFRLKLRDPLKIIDDMVSWVRGIPEKSVADLCSEISNKVLLPSVYKEAISEIEFHKAKNARVVILSSALAIVCQEMAKNLNIDDFICSRLEVKDGYLTGRPFGHICFGEEKAIRLLAYCRSINSMPSDAWYYSDSISDLPALSIVGNPVCVNPDKKLKKAAAKRDWKILSWKS